MSISSGRSTNVGPNRALPAVHLLAGQHGQSLLKRSSGPVLAALTKKENVFDVVLNNRPRLIGFPVESRAVPFHLRHTIRDFVPKDRLQAIETEFAGTHLNVGMQRNQLMTPGAFSGETDITHYAANPATTNQDTMALTPYTVQLGQKMFIVLEMSHLIFVPSRVFFKCPIRR